MDVRLAATTEISNVAAFCRDQGISRSVFYKWRTRYRAEGLDGLRERSRAPKTAARRMSADIEEQVIRLRKQLTEDGYDAGSRSIHDYLVLGGWDNIPSAASIWRLLTAGGFVTPQPKKRPKSSYRSFVYDRPNECWQIDDTTWQLKDGTVVWIVQIIDDHSRVCVGSRAVEAATTQNAWDVFVDGAAEWELPQMVLSDNGLAYNGSRRNIAVSFETNLRALGINPVASTPRHPQTCGKVERFHQTTKKWLNAQPRAGSINELNKQLTDFVDFYNHQRPHSSIGRRTPATVHAAKPKAGPADKPANTPTRITTGRVAVDGSVWSRPWRIAVGRKYAGQAVTTIIDTEHAYIFAGDNLLRHLTLDPTSQYQHLGCPR